MLSVIHKKTALGLALVMQKCLDYPFSKAGRKAFIECQTTRELITVILEGK